MAVYVDDFYKTGLSKVGYMKMSHMIADSRKELLNMARMIGVSSKHIQDKGTAREHFDICMVKRKKAIELGAIELGYRELAEKAGSRTYEGVGGLRAHLEPGLL